MADRSRLLLGGIALVGLLAGGTTALGQFLPVVLGRGPEAAAPWLAAVSGVSFLVSPVAVFAIGYWAGTDVDVARTYDRIGLQFGLVGGVAATLGWAVVAVAAGGMELQHESVAVLFTAGQTSVTTAVSFALTGVAAAAIAHFRTR